LVNGNGKDGRGHVFFPSSRKDKVTHKGDKNPEKQWVNMGGSSIKKGMSNRSVRSHPRKKKGPSWASEWPKENCTRTLN